MRREEMVELASDLADVIHSARIHADSGVCHGDNEGCGGGPDPIDIEYAEVAMTYVEPYLKDVDSRVSTAGDLEALPVGSKVLGTNGEVWRCWSWTPDLPRYYYGTVHTGNAAEGDDVLAHGPLTVVWRPES